MWVRERQVAAVHAWACALGLKLKLRAFPDVAAFMAANEPMTTDLVLGLDLDPGSAADFRLLTAQSLTPRGFVVGGIQMTEEVLRRTSARFGALRRDSAQFGAIMCELSPRPPRVRAPCTTRTSTRWRRR